MHIATLYNGIIRKDRIALSKGITLIESMAKKDRENAQKLMEKIYPHTGRCQHA